MDYYPDPNPALHLVVYSVNQKGRSEAIVLENVPINEAEKRSGKFNSNVCMFASDDAGQQRLTFLNEKGCIKYIHISS